MLTLLSYSLSPRLLVKSTDLVYIRAMSSRLCFAVSLLCAACAGAPSKPVVPPPPSNYDVTVGPMSVIGASKNKPYPGAALVDLRDGSRVEATSEEDFAPLTQPLVWVEPTDPEIHFLNLVVEQPSDAVKTSRGIRIPASRITVGQRYRVRSAKGQRFRVSVKGFTAGDRAKARLVIHVERVGKASSDTKR